MKKYYLQIIIALFSIVLLSNCGSSTKDKDGFETTKSGIKYKFLSRSKDEKRKQIEVGTVVDYHYIVKNHKDSIIQDTYKSKRPIMGFSVIDSTSKGDFYEAIRLLAEGDSAIVKINVDTLIKQATKKINENIKIVKDRQKAIKENKDLDKKTKDAQLNIMKNNLKQLKKQAKNPLPKFFPPKTYINITFKILKVKTKEDIEKEQAEAIKRQEEQRKKQKKEDEKIIKKYLKDNKLNAKSTKSGLYYIIKEKGSGEKAKLGDSVSVQYTGQFIDGKVFDTSIKSIAEKNKVLNPQRTYEPLVFVLGKQPVIKGWEEGLTLLKKGGKATLIVPSDLGYGTIGKGRDIPPNSVLIFEVELINIVQ